MKKTMVRESAQKRKRKEDGCCIALMVIEYGFEEKVLIVMKVICTGLMQMDLFA